MKRRVVVTGLGLVTPCGHTVGETWAALMSGRSGVGYIEKFDTAKFSVKIGAEVVDEARVRRDLVLVHAQLVDDDLLNFILDLLIGH